MLWIIKQNPAEQMQIIKENAQYISIIRKLSQQNDEIHLFFMEVYPIAKSKNSD
jgi:hypothetical protein